MPAALAVAVIAGMVSFASPCVLPLVPGYLGYVTGLTGVDLGHQRRGRLVGDASLFVLGFTIVYVVVTATLASFGGQLQAHQAGITRIAGVAVAGMAMVFAGLVPVAERRIAPGWRPVAGLAGAPLLGAVFAVGWAPCSGPTLAAVMSLATSEGGGAGRGVVLATAYSLGLGIPFILVAMGYARASGVLSVMGRHQRGLQLAGASVLLIVGLLMASGVWTDVITSFQTSIVSGFQVAV